MSSNLLTKVESRATVLNGVAIGYFFTVLNTLLLSFFDFFLDFNWSSNANLRWRLDCNPLSSIIGSDTLLSLKFDVSSCLPVFSYVPTWPLNWFCICSSSSFSYLSYESSDDWDSWDDDLLCFFYFIGLPSSSYFTSFSFFLKMGYKAMVVLPSFETEGVTSGLYFAIFGSFANIITLFIFTDIKINYILIWD